MLPNQADGGKGLDEVVMRNVYCAAIAAASFVALLRPIVSLPALCAPASAAENNQIDAAVGTLSEIRGLTAHGEDASRKLGALPAGRYVLDQGAYRVAANTTIAAGVVLDIRPGSSLAPDRGVTITFKGSVERESFKQIFTGAGRVVGLHFNRPEWWGARNTFGYLPTRDDAAALSAAFASANTPSGYDGDRAKVALSGIYYACKQVDVFVSALIGLEIEGAAATPFAGGVINTCPTFQGTSYPQGSSGGVLAIHGIVRGGNSTTDLKLHDFSVNNTPGSGARAGIVFNPEGAGYALTGGLHEQTVHNIYVGGFATGWALNNIRQFRFSEVSAWNAAASDSLGFLGQALGRGGFVGDMDFENVQTVTCTGNNAKNCRNTGAMTFAALAPETSFAGIRILGDFYASNSGITFTAAAGAQGDDIWINPGTQFDGFFCRAIYATASGTDGAATPKASMIADVHVTHAYHTGGPSAGCPAAHYYAASAGARMQGIVDDNNWFYGIDNPAVVFTNVAGCHADGNVIVNAGATNTAIYIANGTTSCAATGTTLVAGQKTLASVVRIDPETDYISVSGTVGSGAAANVENKSLGTHNVIGDDGAPYGAYIPSLTCQAGTVAVGGAVGRYKRLATTTTSFGLYIFATKIGSCLGRITSSLPLPPSHSNTFLGSDDNVGTLPIYAKNVGGAQNLAIFSTGGGAVLRNSSSIWINGTYETR